MYLQLGSVCEDILWSDSRPAEEREDDDGGRQRKREVSYVSRNTVTRSSEV